MADEDGSTLAPRPARRQSAGAGRGSGGDDRAAIVTSGADRGASGVPRSWREVLRQANPRDLRTAWLIIAPITAVVLVINSLTNLSDLPQVDRWEPWTWEATSAISILLSLWIPWLATAAAPPDEAVGEGWRPKLRFAAIHLTALVAFSALHVAGFVLLRRLVYAAMEAGPYVFGDRFIYELRKDLISYGAFVATFWLIGYLRRRRNEPVRPVSFDIRDGARIIRTPLAEIVAVSSAGNYVEFWLADGRRPLMRATLAAVEVELERFGFVRAHRSWLVNTGAVTGLRPDGSGDWTVELGAVEAPVSRRYPQALERLKG